MNGLVDCFQESDKTNILEEPPMAAETLKADVNEILLGYHILGATWNGFQGQQEAEKKLEFRRGQIGDTEYEIQEERAKVMATKTLDWARANKYGDRVKKAWWTARPGSLSEAVGFPIDSDKNPTDTLIQFETDKFLGISAKSTKGKGDIGFKNPGVGTVDKSLSIKLAKIAQDEEKKFATENNLTKMNKTQMSAIIKRDKELKKVASAARDITLNKIREVFYTKLTRMSKDTLKEYILVDWLDAAANMSLMYIKVTGHGMPNIGFFASLMNPLQNTKLEALHTKNVILEKVGNDSVGVKTTSKRILKMRAKYSEHPMSSSLKFSGEPW